MLPVTLDQVQWQIIHHSKKSFVACSYEIQCKHFDQLFCPTTTCVSETFLFSVCGHDLRLKKSGIVVLLSKKALGTGKKSKRLERFEHCQVVMFMHPKYMGTYMKVCQTLIIQDGFSSLIICLMKNINFLN
jgi:hypothetical protein